MRICGARHPRTEQFCDRVHGHSGHHRYVKETIFVYEKWDDDGNTFLTRDAYA